MAGRFSFPKFRASVLTTGAPLAGGKLYVYENNTVNLTNSYTDRAAGTPNSNPVILDANGEADVWLPAGAQYTLKLDNSADVQQWSVDDVSSNDLSTWLTTGSNIYFSAGKVFVGGSSGSETLTVTGTAAISSTLQVGGAITFDTGLIVNGQNNVGGDFRAASANDTHFLFLDASADILHIGGTGTGNIARLQPTGANFLVPVLIPASTSSTAGLRIQPGTAPSSVFNGDVWNTTDGFHFTVGLNIMQLYTGTGTPESSVTATPGALYLNVSGGASTTLYVKESGTGNTGWVAK